MTTYYDGEDSIHHWFGLSYSAYLVLPRSLIQSMPEDWQKRMVACLREAGDAFEYLHIDDRYEVRIRDDNGRYKSDPYAPYRHNYYKPKLHQSQRHE